MLDEIEYSNGPVVFLLSKRSPVGFGHGGKDRLMPELLVS